MPNYHLSGSIRDHLRGRANQLAMRTLSYALADFPMTVEQIQNAVLPADQLATMRDLSAKGIRTIARHSQVRLAFLREKVPGLRRGVVISLVLPEQIFVDRATQYGMRTTNFDPNEDHYLVPDLSGLSDAERRDLIQWITRVIQQKRMVEITVHASAKIMNSEKLVKTSSHLLALWPMLTTLTESMGQRYDHKRGTWANDTMWRDRFRNPTRSLKAYQPTPETIERWGKLIKVADIVLTAGTVLDEYKHPEREIRATCDAWEHLQGDLNLD